jgi:Mg/Co/Ni transporter MgtE
MTEAWRPLLVSCRHYCFLFVDRDRVVGTLSGSMIPIVLKRLKVDPATSSAPFVATLVDVTGLVIYFTIAAIILKGTLL